MNDSRVPLTRLFVDPGDHRILGACGPGKGFTLRSTSSAEGQGSIAGARRHGSGLRLILHGSEVSGP